MSGFRQPAFDESSVEVDSVYDRYAIEHPHGNWHVAPKEVVMTKRAELPDPYPPYKILRYKVVFTPVGWQVVDKTGETIGEVSAFGSGPEEYERAKAEARRLNEGPLLG